VVKNNSLILTLTRECNLRCSYCPTVKEGWPVLTESSIDQSIELFLSLFQQGDIKLFGGEPLLEPQLVRYTLEAVRDNDNIKKVYLSTNGLGLDFDWIEFLTNYPKAILTLSLDGASIDHRKLRRGLPGVKDSYDHVVSLLPQIHQIPRLVITQTIAPATAKRAYENFQHIRSLGFTRFNFLPGYFIPWKENQLHSLRDNFRMIRLLIEKDWKKKQYLYVRNLFIRAPTPFFNQGMIVDSDSSIHPCNVGLSGTLDHLRKKTQVGSLANPPTLEKLLQRGKTMNSIIQEAVTPRIWESTLAADQELTTFCKELMPAFVTYRKNKGKVA
jgi:sulfatase maturation enzyme AslB (radical SAM superfamily)